MNKTEENNKEAWLILGIAVAGCTLFYLCNKLEEAEQKEDELKKAIKETTETNKKLSEQLVLITSKEINITNNNTFSPSNNFRQTITVNPRITQEVPKEKKNTSQKWKILGYVWEFLKSWIFWKR